MAGVVRYVGLPETWRSTTRNFAASWGTILGKISSAFASIVIEQCTSFTNDNHCPFVPVVGRTQQPSAFVRNV